MAAGVAGLLGGLGLLRALLRGEGLVLLLQQLLIVVRKGRVNGVGWGEEEEEEEEVVVVVVEVVVVG